jgi:hypothetical protein
MIDCRSAAEALGDGLEAEQRTRVRIGPGRKTSLGSDGPHARSSRGGARDGALHNT